MGVDASGERRWSGNAGDVTSAGSAMWRTSETQCNQVGSLRCFESSFYVALQGDAMLRAWQDNHEDVTGTSTDLPHTVGGG
jgi:hypothetical protein